MVIEFESIKKQKEEELKRISEIIQKRKSDAIKDKLYDNIYKIAHVLGEYSDWGGNQYRYWDPLTRLDFDFSSNGNYCKVITNKDKKLFSARENHDIDIYIPGDWEKRIPELLKECEIKKQKSEIKNLQKEIDQLKDKWGINFDEKPPAEIILWENNDKCPVCGDKVNPEIKACETGYHYCSNECANKHVNENVPEGGY